MSSVASTPNSSLPSLQNQLAQLQKQCADWESCATTPPSQKQQLVAGLQQQIHAVEGKIASIDHVADGINRPVQDPFARQGTLLNTFV